MLFARRLSQHPRCTWKQVYPDSDVGSISCAEKSPPHALAHAHSDQERRVLPILSSSWRPNKPPHDTHPSRAAADPLAIRHPRPPASYPQSRSSYSPRPAQLSMHPRLAPAIPIRDGEGEGEHSPTGHQYSTHSIRRLSKAQARSTRRRPSSGPTLPGLDRAPVELGSSRELISLFLPQTAQLAFSSIERE